MKVTNKEVVVFLADGFEECEGLIVVDLLRRAGINVITASVMGRREITSSHSILIQADMAAEDVDYSGVDMIVLPGGFHGTNNLRESEIVREQCLSFSTGKYVAAICAAPGILAELGLLDEKEATCHPSVEDKMNTAILTHSNVAVADNIITGRGLGAGIPFALELVGILAGPDAAEQVRASICYANAR